MLYARTLGITPEDFRRKVTEAIDDFRTIAPRRHVEVYLTTAGRVSSLMLGLHQDGRRLLPRRVPPQPQRPEPGPGSRW